jgi:hypothetical protein
MLQDSKEAEVVQLSACYLSRLSSDQNANSRSNEGAGGKIDEVVCGGACWFLPIPTKKRGFFNSSYFSWHPADLDFSRRGDRYLTL